MTEDKLALSRQLGAEITGDAKAPDAATQLIKDTGGAGNFPTSIFDLILKRITIRGSIVGTRKDLSEAIEFANEGKVKAHIHKATLDDVNSIFGDLGTGKVDGPMVMTL